MLDGEKKKLQLCIAKDLIKYSYIVLTTYSNVHCTLYSNLRNLNFIDSVCFLDVCWVLSGSPHGGLKKKFTNMYWLNPYRALACSNMYILVPVCVPGFCSNDSERKKFKPSAPKLSKQINFSSPPSPFLWEKISVSHPEISLLSG